MRYPHFLLMVLLASTLMACGGGSSGGSSSNSSGSGGSSSSGGSGGGSASGTFTLDTRQIYIFAEVGVNSADAGVVSASVADRNEPVYILIDVSKASHFISSADVVTYGENSGDLILNPISEYVLDAGIYQGTVDVSVCGDANCNTHLSGSPRTVNVTYEIIPDQTQTDSDGDGFMNADDMFPDDALEWLDTDADGVGNNADLDDDNDGVADASDSLPLEKSLSNVKTTLNFHFTGKAILAVYFDGSMQEIECDNGCSYDYYHATEMSDGTYAITASTNTLQLRFSDQDSAQFESWGDNQYCVISESNVDSENADCIIVSRCDNYPNAYCPEGVPLAGAVSNIDFDVQFADNDHINIVGNTVGGSFVSHSGEVQCFENCEQKIYLDNEEETTLTPIPFPGYVFDGWQGDCAGTGDCVLNFDNAKTYTVSALFSPADNDVAICTDNNQNIVGNGVDRLDGLGEIRSVAFICGGQVFLAAVDNSHIYQRDLVNQVTLATYTLDSPAIEMVFDSVNNLLYATHYSSNLYSQTISRIDLATAVVTRIHFPGLTNHLALSSTGELFVAHSYDVVDVLNGQTGLRINRNTVKGAIDGIQYLNESNMILTKSNAYQFNQSNAALTEFALSIAPDFSLYFDSIFASSDASSIFNSSLTYDEGQAQVTDYRLLPLGETSMVINGYWAVDGWVTSASFSPSNNYVLIGTSTATLYNNQTYAVSYNMPLSGCTYNTIDQMLIGDDSKIMLTLRDCDASRSKIDWAAYPAE